MKAVGLALIVAGILVQIWKRRAPGGVTTTTASGQTVTSAQPTGTPGTTAPAATSSNAQGATSSASYY